MLLRSCLVAAGFVLCLEAAGQDVTRGVEALSGDQETSQLGYANRHALVIGIDEYEDSGYRDLSYAVADAQAIAKSLVRRFGFPEDNVRLILNAEASNSDLNRALEEWLCEPQRIGPDDLVVVFFAGHGVTREVSGGERAGYLVPPDGLWREQRPSWSTLLNMRELQDTSEMIPAKHVLFILDCCFGGLAITRSSPPLAAGLRVRAKITSPFR
jgi:uncharacterized caspase-like protein